MQNNNNWKCALVLLLVAALVTDVQMFVLQGKFIAELNNKERILSVPNRGYYNQSEFRVKIGCTPGTSVKIGWLLRFSECVDEFYMNSNQLPVDIFERIYQRPNIVLLNYPYVWYEKPELQAYTCDPNTDTIDIFVSPFGCFF